LGSDIVTNGGFDNATGWTYNIGGDASEVVISDGVLNFVGTTGESGVYQSMNQAGGVYKVTLDITSYTAGGVRIEMSGGVPDTSTFNSVGSHTAYITDDAVGAVNVFLTATGTTTLTVDNLVIKLVKMGNHGTTTFYGDELVTNGDFNTDISSWTASGTPVTWERNTSTPIDGSGDAHYVASASVANNGIISNAVSLTSGRTYRITFTYRKVGSPSVKYKVSATSAVGGANIGGTVDVTLAATSNTAYSLDITPTETDSTSYLIFYFAIDAEFYVDKISFKEIGVAAGWTTADAEPLIPQTALMGMSKPMVFDGRCLMGLMIM